MACHRRSFQQGLFKSVTKSRDRLSHVTVTKQGLFKSRDSNQARFV